MAITLNATQLVTAAFRDIGALGHGETLQSEDLANGLEALNLVLETYVVPLKGLHISLAEETITIVASTASYSLNSATVDVLSVNYRSDTSNDTFLNLYGYGDYDRLTKKTDTSSVHSMAFFKNLATPTITLFPIPSDATYSLVVREVRTTTESTPSNGTLQVPQRLFLPVKYLVAAEIGPSYRGPAQLIERYRKMGKDILLEMMDGLKDKNTDDIVPGTYPRGV
jgi:hypothetical protein